MSSTISQTTAAIGATVSTAQAQGSNKLGKDEFLKLLMAQMANQDPTAPADSQAFVAQLAQFSNVELLQDADKNLQSLLVAQASANQTMAASFVGKDVTWKSDSVMLQAGKVATVDASLQGAASGATAVISDATGRTVRTLKLGASNAGTIQFGWDGLDDKGASVAAGRYQVRVTATDPAGKSVGVDQRMSGHVSGISFSSGFPQLMVGSDLIALSQIEELHQPAPG